MIKGVTPELETVLTATGPWQFAGPESNDDGPSFIEILADGEVEIELFRNVGDVKTKVPTGTPSWGLLGEAGRWPASVPVGNDHLTVYGNIPRQFDIRGTGAYEILVTFISASIVTISASKER